MWEPVPNSCVPEELDNCHEATKSVDLVSPNHAELAAFFGETGNIEDCVDKPAIERFADVLYKSGSKSGRTKAVVVRAGKAGCLLADANGAQWIPAYHQSESSKVIDPTGGGNTFLGGLGIALARGRSLHEAAIWGSVAASFAIEQVGVPTLTESADGERWNGVRVQDRLDEFLQQTP